MQNNCRNEDGPDFNYCDTPWGKYILNSPQGKVNILPLWKRQNLNVAMGMWRWNLSGLGISTTQF